MYVLQHPGWSLRERGPRGGAVGRLQVVRTPRCTTAAGGRMVTAGGTRSRVKGIDSMDQEHEPLDTDPYGRGGEAPAVSEEPPEQQVGGPRRTAATVVAKCQKKAHNHRYGHRAASKRRRCGTDWRRVRAANHFKIK